MKNVMSLPIEQRYLTKKAFCSGSSKGNKYKTAKKIGCSAITVSTAIQYCANPWPIVKSGRTKKLQSHHILFIESCTITDLHLTNAQIADLLVQVFDDIDSCSPNILMNARHELTFQFSPPRRSVYVSPNAMKKRVD